MNIELDCLRDCNAWCCTSRTLIFDFTRKEARFMKDSGADLTHDPVKKGYYMNKDCPFLKDGRCDLHGKKNQPMCCEVNKAGGELCLFLRSRVFKQREIE